MATITLEHVRIAKSNTITQAQLVKLLKEVVGAVVVSFTAKTDARCKKTGNPFGTIYKRSEVNGMINWVYENAVNRQLLREGKEADFAANPRQWGERIKGTPFVWHKGRTYIELKVERVLVKPEYMDEAGNPLTAEQVVPFLPAKHSSADHQGVEKEIILRDYGIESIEEMRINGRRYTISG